MWCYNSFVNIMVMIYDNNFENNVGGGGWGGVVVLFYKINFIQILWKFGYLD